MHSAALAPAVSATFQVVHAGLVSVGVLVVIAMLSPLTLRRRHRDLTELRAGARDGSLVSRADGTLRTKAAALDDSAQR